MGLVDEVLAEPAPLAERLELHAPDRVLGGEPALALLAPDHLRPLGGVVAGHPGTQGTAQPALGVAGELGEGAHRDPIGRREQVHRVTCRTCASFDKILQMPCRRRSWDLTQLLPRGIRAGA